MRSIRTFIPFLVLALAIWPSPSHAQILLEWELGMAVAATDDIRVPSDGGTLFSAVDDLSTDPGFAQRIRIGYAFGSGRHTVSFLYVPFAIQADGEFDRPVSFEDVVFQAGIPTLGQYKLNSGRLGYRYGAISQPRFRLGVGGSAMVREASISLENTVQAAAKSRVDLMPLLSADARWFLTETISAMGELEGAVFPGGRSLDALFGVDVEPADRFRFRVGYRLTAATIDRVAIYNAVIIHQGVLGIIMLI